MGEPSDELVEVIARNIVQLSGVPAVYPGTEPDPHRLVAEALRAAHDAGLIVYVEDEDRDVQGIALRLEDERDALKAENEQLREILRIKGWFDPSFS